MVIRPNWYPLPEITGLLFFAHEIQACLVLLHFTLLHFTDVVFFTNWRLDPPLAKRLQLALLRCCETEPAVSLRDVCVDIS